MKHWLLFALLLNSPPALANSILQNVIDSTGTTVFLTREDIARLPAYGYREWASLQTSAVLKRGFLHLRGGRSDEIAVYIDGILQRHPFTGDPLTDIAPSLAEQVVITTGGFSAEYGHAMSGVIHITTPQNSQSLTGSIEGLTDHFSRPSFGHDALALALGSPIIPNRTTFFISGDWRDHADANPRHGVTAHETERDKLSSQTFTALADGRLPHNRLTTRTLRGHLNNRLTDRIHITAHLTDARSQRDYYIHTYRYNLPHAPTTLQQSRNAMLSLHYVHNPRTTFIARLGATTISDHQGDGTHQQDLSAYIRPTGNPNFDLTRLFYQGDADSTDLSTNAEGFVIGDEGHVYNEFIQQNTRTYTPINFKLTQQMVPNHILHAGLNFNIHQLRYYQHLAPGFRGPSAFRNVIRYGGYFAVEAGFPALDFFTQEIRCLFLTFGGQGDLAPTFVYLFSSLNWSKSAVVSTSSSKSRISSS